jgi:hypothetical protein
MSEENKLKLVEDFIYDDTVQHILTEINSNVMDFNILEITGMGSQEIKHSNILGWLFDDSEHNLEYQILDGFLKKVVQEKDNECNKLHEYIYLANKKRDITIYREKDNIDLLIVDESNKIVIAIENKIYANERKDGEDGGQLNKYENIINKKYDDTYNKYFIFLTIDLEKPSKHIWLKASHQMITSVIENILEAKETTIKTKIVLESYVDLLKRNGIVEDEKLKELCEKIWIKKEYEEALDIINEYRVTQVKRIFDRLKNELAPFPKNDYAIELDGIKKLYEKFDLVWDKTEGKQFFEFHIVYQKGKNDQIWLGYYYPELGEQNDVFQEICKNITGKKNKEDVTVLIIDRDYIRDKDIDTVVKEIHEKIEAINKNIIETLKQHEAT